MKVPELDIPGSEWFDELDARGKRIRRLVLLPGEWDLPRHLVNEHGFNYNRGGREWDRQYYAHLRLLRIEAAGVEEIMYRCDGDGGHLITIQYTNLYGENTPLYTCPTHNVVTVPTLPR